MTTRKIDETICKLADLKMSLESLMDPKLLSKLASLLEAFGGRGRSFAEQYKFWVEKNGPDCRYAAMAKEFFLKENSENVAKVIIELYNDWAKHYERK